MNIKKLLSSSVLAIGFLAVSHTNAGTITSGNPDDSLDTPAPFNLDQVTLTNSGSDPDAPEVFFEDVAVNIGDIGSRGVLFEFNFTGTDVVQEGIITNSDSSLNSFQDGTETLQADLQADANVMSDVLGLAGIDLELSSDPSNTFIAYLTADFSDFADAYAFAGDQDESRWYVGALEAGTYNLNIVSLLPAINAGTITISAVPIPAAAILFGTALAGFAGFSARRKA